MLFLRRTIDEDIVKELKRIADMKIAEAIGANNAYKEAKLSLCLDKVKFRKGDKITVNFSNGKVHYIFEKIDWGRYGESMDVIGIYGSRMLKSGKPSKGYNFDIIESSNGPLSYDDPIFTEYNP